MKIESKIHAIISQQNPNTESSKLPPNTLQFPIAENNPIPQKKKSPPRPFDALELLAAAKQFRASQIQYANGGRNKERIVHSR